MKRLLAAVLCLLLTFLIPTAPAEELPERFRPILERWNAKDIPTLKARLEDAYWAGYPSDWRVPMPLNIRVGGDTEALLRDRKQWDLAIISSKEVDVQRLADEGILMSSGHRPASYQARVQRRYPAAVQSLLPNDPLRVYDIYCYSYDAAAHDATLLLCRANEGNRLRAPELFAGELLDSRTPDEVRALEGVIDVSWRTVEELLDQPNTWDIARVSVESYTELNALDEAGLLYDMSANPALLTRERVWAVCPAAKPSQLYPVPAALFSDDGRLIALPYAAYAPGYPHPCQAMVINARSASAALALADGLHWLKSYEWFYDKIVLEGDGNATISKDEMDW